jgi:hypothetical protein
MKIIMTREKKAITVVEISLFLFIWLLGGNTVQVVLLPEFCIRIDFNPDPQSH